MLSMAVLAERQFLNSDGILKELTLFDSVERNKTDALGTSPRFPPYRTAIEPIKLKISSC